MAGVSISSFADFSVEACKYFLEILEPLVRDGFISAENARFLGNRIKGLPLLEGETTTIEWLGGLKSLATLLTVLYAFGSLEIGNKMHNGDGYSEIRPVLSSFSRTQSSSEKLHRDHRLYARDSYQDSGTSATGGGDQAGRSKRPVSNARSTMDDPRSITSTAAEYRTIGGQGRPTLPELVCASCSIS